MYAQRYSRGVPAIAAVAIASSVIVWLAIVALRVPADLDAPYRTQQTSDYQPVDRSFEAPQTSAYRLPDRTFHTPQTSEYEPGDRSFHTPQTSDCRP